MSVGLQLLAPFAEFSFMRRALVACLALALGCGPVGTLLLLRQMSLIGDAMSHAVLPGAAIGFAIAGLSLASMSIGGIIAGLLVALLSGIVTRTTGLREDASFAAIYLISLAAGVLIVSTHGSNVDLLHVLFGTVLAIDDPALFMVASIGTATLLTLSVVYRPLLMECFDPGFLRTVGGNGTAIHALFLTIVVLNLVSGFQALGTLMAFGLMMLPAAAARFWAREVWSLMVCSSAIGFASGLCGLLLSFHAELPSGPAIILTAGLFYGISVLVGPRGSIRTRYLVKTHLSA